MSTTAPGVGVANWGPLVVGTDVDDQLIATMVDWMPTYLRQIRSERNLSFNLARPRFYGNTFAGQEMLDHQLPAVIVETAQLAMARGGPNKDYEGTWTVNVATVVRGKTPKATRWLAALYEGTQRRLLLQKARDGVVVSELHCVGQRNQVVADATGSGRWLLAGVSMFQAHTDRIVGASSMGPDEPDRDVYVDEATIVEVDVEVDEISPGGSFT